MGKSLCKSSAAAPALSSLDRAVIGFSVFSTLPPRNDLGVRLIELHNKSANTPSDVVSQGAHLLSGGRPLRIGQGCGDACPYIPGKRYIDWELLHDLDHLRVTQTCIQPARRHRDDEVRLRGLPKKGPRSSASARRCGGKRTGRWPPRQAIGRLDIGSVLVAFALIGSVRFARRLTTR